MRIIFNALLISANLFLAAFAAKDVPTSQLLMKILGVSRAGTCTIEISSTSKEPTKLWKESNSWGAARWRIVRIRAGQVEVFFQNPDQSFTRNIPTSDEIVRGAHVERKLDLNGGNWCGLGHCSSFDERGLAGKQITFEPNDIVVAIYDVPLTQEATRLNVWHGVISASMTVE
jgi:hypothetical protein